MLSKLKNMDDKVVVNVKKLHRDNLNKFMVIVTKLGNNGMVWFAVAVPLLFNRGYRNVGVKIILALLLSGFLGEVLIKHIVARVRPSKFLLQEEMLIKEPITYSFPSGHTSSSFAASCMLASCFGIISTPAFVLAFLIGFSRVYLRVHYLTDVLVGAILGSFCSLLVNVFIPF